MKKATIRTYLKKNDRVMVITGKDKGKAGKIIRLDIDKGRAFVEGVNMVKRHTKPGPNTKGGILEKEASIHVSNIMLICPKCTDPVRISKKIFDDGAKVRICKKCGEEVPTEKK
jgi:large subunit ribosomal protein L24